MSQRFGAGGGRLSPACWVNMFGERSKLHSIARCGWIDHLQSSSSHAQPALIIRRGNCRCGGKRTRRSNRWHVAHSADLVADGGGDGWVCSSIFCSVPLRALKMGLDAKLCVLYFNHISNLLEAFSELRCIRQPHTFVSLSSGCGE